MSFRSLRVNLELGKSYHQRFEIVNNLHIISLDYLKREDNSFYEAGKKLEFPLIDFAAPHRSLLSHIMRPRSKSIFNDY